MVKLSINRLSNVISRTVFQNFNTVHSTPTRKQLIRNATRNTYIYVSPPTFNNRAQNRDYIMSKSFTFRFASSEQIVVHIGFKLPLVSAGRKWNIYALNRNTLISTNTIHCCKHSGNFSYPLSDTLRINKNYPIRNNYFICYNFFCLYDA